MQPSPFSLSGITWLSQHGTGSVPQGFYVFVHFFILSVASPIVAVIAAVASIIALL